MYIVICMCMCSYIYIYHVQYMYLGTYMHNSLIHALYRA